MRSGRSIGVLPVHQLKRIHLLGLEVVPERETIVVPPDLIEARPDRIVVDLLRGIGVEGSRIDIRAVGELGGEGADDLLNQLASRRILGERRPLIGRQNQHIAVDVAADALLAAVEEDVAAAPQGRPELKAVVIRSRRFDITNLEEGPRGENAVVVGLVEAAAYA